MKNIQNKQFNNIKNINNIAQYIAFNNEANYNEQEQYNGSST